MSQKVEFDLYTRDRASDGIDDVGKAADTTAGKLSAMGKSASTSADDVSKAGAKLKKSSEETAKGFDRASEASDQTYKKFDSLESLGRGTSDTMSGLGAIMSGDVLQGSTDLAGGVAALADGFSGALIPGLRKAWTAVTNLTVVQKILNVVMRLNPIGLVITAITLLVGIFVVAYQKSETFRNIVNGAFEVVKRGAQLLALAGIKAFRFLLSIWLAVAGGIVHGAANAFGWVPGLGPKLQGAAAGFDRFKDSVNRSLDKVESDLTVSMNTKPADKSLTAFYKKWQGKSLVIRANTHMDVGNFRGGGSGGGLGRPVNAPIGTGWNGYPGHKGVDFPVKSGTPVHAVMSGRVVDDGWDPGGFGYHVRTIDADGKMTILGHMTREIVRVGQSVARGQTVGYSGSTGNSSGPHVHMERRYPPFGPGSAYNFTPMLFDRGGVLPPGLSLVRNNTGRPEPLARTDEPRVFKIYIDGRELRQSTVRVERQNG